MAISPFAIVTLMQAFPYLEYYPNLDYYECTWSQLYMLHHPVQLHCSPKRAILSSCPEVLPLYLLHEQVYSMHCCTCWSTLWMFFDSELSMHDLESNIGRKIQYSVIIHLIHKVQQVFCLGCQASFCLQSWHRVERFDGCFEYGWESIAVVT